MSAEAAPRVRWIWASAIAALAAAALAAADAHGHGSRVPFDPPPELEGQRLGMVGNAADAFRVWQGALLRGRRLVVLSGQWARPVEREGGKGADGGPAADQGAPVDPRSALFAAARSGLVRALDVVLVPAAFASRLQEVSGRKELVREDGAFQLPASTIPRRFALPRAFAAPPEPVLVLVEPSWFAEGAPPDPLAWLRDGGATWDLALLALEDPVATAAQRQAALAYGQAVGARYWEAPP
jgi:hypothetical protein